MAPTALPAFESHDPYPFQVLPDGVHRADEASLRQRFVDDFPDSLMRPTIYDGFFLLRQDALNKKIIATQWIDGSFVEGKLDPEDIDLVSFIDYDFFIALGPAVQHFVLGCLKGGETTKPQYACHTFLVPSCLPGHPFHADFEKIRAYWRKWFGQTREEPIRPGPSYPSIPKGLVEMILGDPQRALADFGGKERIVNTSSQRATAPTARSVRQIREQLADLAPVKASAEAYGERDAASKMAPQSIYANEKQLLEELRAAELLEATQKSNGAVQHDRAEEGPSPQSSE